ncbi:glycosyl hydrolase [Sphingomonas sp. Leaf231]|uniref:glycoside hydrolase family 43 protein n=1 Tax=Sphingomonas sp. Leaf231 TaxID=1736301 RepID=UPI0006F3DC72|nr:glycoside hydrolase 43 family protein [Sphingomonas sp. Leaf231]KQN92415.1 glycosyl hydrolase [Sphingomonas sp. Leaf231]
MQPLTIPPLRRLVHIAVTALTGVTAAASAQVWQSDRGDGTYANPPLNADYPDPDIIRVGADFYFASTTFANVPGLTLLHSRDLVNWDIVSHLIPRLDGEPPFDARHGGSYRHGIYAPSLRYRDGTFYVAVTPVGQHTRVYRARDPKGPWTYVTLDRAAFDPALFFDDDGTAYLATSIGSDGTITLHTLDRGVARITASRVIHYNKGAEGSKIIKRAGFYYLFNAIPGRLALTVSRARALAGPWETRAQIDDTTGGHQGALVDLPGGGWYGFVMRDAGAIGRVTNISPVFWRDDWPVWGTPDAPGRVPDVARKPIPGAALRAPPASDEFGTPVLGRQWQWNHDPLDRRWSLTRRPGWLRLHAAPGDQLWWARNTLLQKGQAPRARGEVVVDTRGLRPGDVCGFGTFGKFAAQLSVVGGQAGRRTLTMRVTEDRADGPHVEVREPGRPVKAHRLWLRTDMDFPAGFATLSYSEDGRRFTPLGGDVPLVFDWRTGTFQGVQFALSCYNPATRAGGWIDIDRFTLSAFAPPPAANSAPQ